MIVDLGTSKAIAGTHVLTRAFRLERVTGIEPALSAWESDRPAGEESASVLPALLAVLNLTVTVVTVADNADLVLGFDDGVTLRVAGAPSAWTTHDVWWLGDPRA